MTKLYLIRHGEAYSNVEADGPIAGMLGDKGLTDLGKLQAERLRDRLAASREIAADVLIASTLPRARQTAEIIAPALGLPIQFDDDVQEMRPGEADGMPLPEAAVRYKLGDLRTEPYRRFAPGGESWAEFVLRVGTALDRIVREHAGKTIVVVAHGGVVDSSLLIFMKMHTLTPPVSLFTHNTAITQWEREHDDDEHARWRLVHYNDDHHVKDLLVDRREEWRKAMAEVGQSAAAVAAEEGE